MYVASASLVVSLNQHVLWSSKKTSVHVSFPLAAILEAYVSQEQEVYPGITVDPDVLYGVPVISGTRLPITFVLGQMAAGYPSQTCTDAITLLRKIFVGW